MMWFCAARRFAKSLADRSVGEGQSSAAIEDSRSRWQSQPLPSAHAQRHRNWRKDYNYQRPHSTLTYAPSAVVAAWRRQHAVGSRWRACPQTGLELAGVGDLNRARFEQC
jgi:hypothetical protein